MQRPRGGVNAEVREGPEHRWRRLILRSAPLDRGPKRRLEEPWDRPPELREQRARVRRPFLGPDAAIAYEARAE